MKNKELINKILNMIDDIVEETKKEGNFNEDTEKYFETTCKFISLKLIEKIGKEDL